MDPEGIQNACTRNALISRARRNATSTRNGSSRAKEPCPGRRPPRCARATGVDRPVRSSEASDSPRSRLPAPSGAAPARRPAAVTPPGPIAAAGGPAVDWLDPEGPPAGGTLRSACRPGATSSARGPGSARGLGWAEAPALGWEDRSSVLIDNRRSQADRTVRHRDARNARRGGPSAGRANAGSAGGLRRTPRGTPDRRRPSAPDRLALLLDLRGLATEIAKIVQLRTADVAPGHDLDLGDDGGVHGKGPLDADTEAHLAHGEGLAHAPALSTDHHPLEDLDTLAVALDDAYMHLERVARPEVRHVAAQGCRVDAVQGVHGVSSWSWSSGRAVPATGAGRRVGARGRHPGARSGDHPPVYRRAQSSTLPHPPRTWARRGWRPAGRRVRHPHASPPPPRHDPIRRDRQRGAARGGAGPSAAAPRPAAIGRSPHGRPTAGPAARRGRPRTAGGCRRGPPEGPWRTSRPTPTRRFPRRPAAAGSPPPA